MSRVRVATPCTEAEAAHLLEDKPRVPAARARAAAGIMTACAALGVVAAIARSSLLSSLPPESEDAELYRKKLVYGPGYGALLGDDRVQKAWPGLTCERTDDDKWGWAEEPMMQPLDSGTNCVWGDTWFCTNANDTQKYDGTNKSYVLMTTVSQLMWNHCNASCNATDELRVHEYGTDAHLVGTSALNTC